MRWEKAVVCLTLNNGHTVTVEGQSFGPLCIHRPVVADGCKPRTWVITHIPTGLSIGVATGIKRDAKLIAEHLVTNYGDAISRKTSAEVCAAIPPGVVDWLRACSSHMRYFPVPA